MNKLSIIIPCYNEEEGINNLDGRLSPILDELGMDWELEIIFVDDGSTDRTKELLELHFGSRVGVRVISHEINKNLGAAMRTGFEACTGDVVITMDSDCTYDPEGIFEMLNLLDEETSIITASPYHPKGKVEGVPEYRLFLSKAISWIYRLVTGAKIHTFTALFRVQRKEVVKNITFKSNNFLATAEMLIYALMKDYGVKEYPTTLQVRKYGVSKMKLFLVIKSHLKFLLKLIWLRLIRGLKG
jgi:dolichol-phosphate mannosyltransferase